MKKNVKIVLFSNEDKISKKLITLLKTFASIITCSEIKELKVELEKKKTELLIIDYGSLGHHLDSLKQVTKKYAIPSILIINRVSEKVLDTCLKLGVVEYIPLTKLTKTILKEKIINAISLLSAPISPSKVKYKDFIADSPLNNEKLLHVIADHFPNSYMAIIDSKLIIKYTGGEEFRKNKIDHKLYIGKNVYDAFSRQSKDTSENIIKAYKKTLKGKQQSFQIKIKDQHFHYRTVPLVQANKKIDSLLVIAENVTEKLAYENKLKLSEETFRTTLDRITDGFVAFDNKWLYTYMNKKASEVFNRDPQKVIGKHIEDEFPDFGGQIFYKEYKKAMREQKFKFLEEYYLPYKKWFENYIYPSATGITIYFRDVTKRKLIEQSLHETKVKAESALRIGNIGYWEWDIVNDELYWSDRMYEIFDIPINTLLDYNSVIKLIHPDDRDDHKEFVTKAINAKKNAVFNYRTVRKNGSIRHIECRLAVLSDKHGDVIKLQGTVIDNTEKKGIETELKNSEKKYRNLVEQSSDGIFTIDQAGHFLSMNKSTSKMVGYTPKEMESMTIFDFIFKEELEKQPFRFQDMNSGILVTTERLMKRKNKPPIVIEIKSKLISSDKYLITIQDISKRKLEQTELLNSRNLFQNLIENILGVYYVANLDTKQTLYISPSYENITGRTCKDLYKNLDDYFLSVHPDDLQRLIDTQMRLLKTKKENLLFRIIKPNGEIRWIDSNKHLVIDKNGANIEYCFSEDVTEKNKIEHQNLLLLKRNQQIIGTMTDGFILAEEQGQIIEVNHSYCDLSGYSANELLLKNINDLEYNLTPITLKKRIEGMTKNHNLNFQTKHKKKDNEIVDLEVNLSIMQVEQKQLVAMFIKDITEQLKSNLQIKEYTEQLRQLTTHLQDIREEERAALSRELHDEIGQQLMAIKIDVSRLSSRLNNDEQSNILLEEIKHLIDESVSTVRKINSELRPSLLDDMGLFAALEYQVKEISKRTNIKFDLKINMTEPKLDEKVSIGVFRIFQESLTNILRHANADKVQAKLVEKAGKMELSISDNGKGFVISDGGIQKTFGLLGMKERASMMHGNLQVNSIPGKGTTLHLTVPIDENMS